MNTFLSIANFLAGISTLLFFAGALLIVLSFFIRTSFFDKVRTVASQKGILLGLVVSTIAVFGSLYYSEIAGYEPCTLCWWARVSIYPMFVLFALAYKYKDEGVFRYTFVLSLLGLFFSGYHNYLSWGGSDIGICDNEALCNKLYVNEFGFVTIPLMGLGVIVFLLALSINKRIKNNG